VKRSWYLTVVYFRITFRITYSEWQSDRVTYGSMSRSLSIVHSLTEQAYCGLTLLLQTLASLLTFFMLIGFLLLSVCVLRTALPSTKVCDLVIVQTEQ